MNRIIILFPTVRRTRLVAFFFAKATGNWHNYLVATVKPLNNLSDFSYNDILTKTKETFKRANTDIISFFRWGAYQSYK